MTAFATVADLSARLKVTAPEEGSATYTQYESALDDATGDLQAEIGQQIVEQADVVEDAIVPVGNVVHVAAVPLRSVSSVVLTEGGGAVEFKKRDAHAIAVEARAGVQVTITYTAGYASVPAELKKWCCVLAAASIAAAEYGNLGLAGGVAGVGVDDARVSFATNNGEQGQGVTLPETVIARLRARYGAPMMTVEHRP